jgi:hypothetical protein
MVAQSAASNHIDITETLVRLYVFLAQSLDRCIDAGHRQAFSEKDHMAFLNETRSKLMEILRVNPVVKSKIENECERVLTLVDTYLRAGLAPDTRLEEQIKSERTLLQIKLIALSDLLAVFRAV